MKGHEGKGDLTYVPLFSTHPDMSMSHRLCISLDLVRLFGVL